MKITLSLTISFIISFIICYIIIVFVGVDWDMFNWHIAGRLINIMIPTMVVFIKYFLYIDNKNDDKDGKL